MKLLTTYKYKLKPTKAQRVIFEQWLGACRYVYNVGMEIKNTTYKKTGKGIGKYDLMKQLTQAKADVRWLNDVHSQVLQQVLDRLDKTYQNFFKGAGYPKFARKEKYNSFTFKAGVKILPNTYCLNLPKIGKVKFFKDRINIEPKIATIIKENGSWYISVTGYVEKVIYKETDKKIGIDVGIKTFAVTSDGETFESPKALRKNELRLKKLQKEISKKKKGSNNRKKAISTLRKLHSKVSNTRKDFAHKVSTKLVRENQSISVEKLNVKGMVKNHKLAKSINDASWTMFKTMLKYKSEYHNREFIEVAARNTSKMCSCCGNLNDDLKLSIREWTCALCGTKHDRDLNASINIRNKGFGLNLSTCGEYVNPVFINRSFSVNQEPHLL